jgi:colanic acid/amylovoran biosynthesis glycosyltransferase
MEQGIEDRSVTRVAHVVWSYLASSETFIYTQLMAQAQLDQIVLARNIINRGAFPFTPIYALDRLGTRPQLGRVVRRMRRLAPGPDSFERRIARRISTLAPDLIHAHFGFSGRAAVHAAVQSDIPLVTAFHGLDVYSPRAVAGVRDPYDDVFRVGAAFTCVGPKAGEELVRLGCPPARLRIVPVGLDLTAFPFRPQTSSGTFRLLQIARLVPKKGVDLTLKAFALVREELGETELSIVGEGPLRAELMALAATLGITEQVKFYGATPPNRVRELIAAADLGVQPSRIAPSGDREGTPTVILEFEAMGVHVIATDHADIPSIVPDPAALVPEDDVEGLAEAILDARCFGPTERNDRTRAGRALVEERHDAAKIADSLQSIYQDAVLGVS